MNQYGESPWSEERVALLRKLWTEGLSASQCAKRLGDWATRSAVCAKISRIGLAGRGQQRLTSSRARMMKARSAKAKRTPPEPQREPRHLARTAPKVGRPEAKPNKFDASPESQAAMALLGNAYSADKRREMFWGAR